MNGARIVRRTRAVLGLPPIDRAAFAGIARAELPQIARIVIVAAVGWQVCVWLGASLPPIYAVIVPLVSLKSDPFSAFSLSWSRLVGVLIGLLVGLTVLRFMQPGLAAVALVLGLALLVGMVIRIGNASNMQVAVSALLVFVNPDAGEYGLTRLWETGVGTAVTALLTPFLFPADPLKAARRELAGIADTLTSTLRDSVRIAGAGDLSSGERVRQLVGLAERLDGSEAALRTLATQIGTAGRTAKWSVLRRRELRAVTALEPVRELAARTAANIQAFAEEAVAFAERSEFAQDTQLRHDALIEMAEPVAMAIDGALAGRSIDAELVRAREAWDAFVVSEHTRVASVVRRPLTRILEDLERFAAG